MNKINKRVLIYTMTDGLGDYFVIGDLIRTAAIKIPNTECIVVHRGNKHVHLWPYGNSSDRFFSIYSLTQLVSLVLLLHRKRKNGAKVFAFQMAPGSVQGFLFFALLRKFGLIDFIVDFNLINADIITPPVGGKYILHLHLDQLAQLFDCPKLDTTPRLELPLRQWHGGCETKGPPLFGIHPWTRRSSLNLKWPDSNWLEIVDYLITCGGIPVLFGKDVKFGEFGKVLIDRYGADKVCIKPSASVEDLVKTVASLSLLISLNSSVIHVAYACKVRTVVLSGPHLSIWTPIDVLFREVRDPGALFPPSDERKSHEVIAMVSRIATSDVKLAIDNLLNRP